MPHQDLLDRCRARARDAKRGSRRLWSPWRIRQRATASTDASSTKWTCSKGGGVQNLTLCRVHNLHKVRDTSPTSAEAVPPYHVGGHVLECRVPHVDRSQTRRGHHAHTRHDTVHSPDSPVRRGLSLHAES